MMAHVHIRSLLSMEKINKKRKKKKKLSTISLGMFLKCFFFGAIIFMGMSCKSEAKPPQIKFNKE